MSPEPGWYPDPDGAPGLQRYWDGKQWTQHFHPPQTVQVQVSSGGGNTVLKVALGVALGGVLLIGGCIALIGAGAEKASEDFKREQAAHAITNGQARAIALKTTRRDVVAKLGAPESDQESSNEGLGDSSCIYYNVVGGELLDSWQFCFDGVGPGAVLRSKNRL